MRHTVSGREENSKKMKSIIVIISINDIILNTSGIIND